MEGRYRSLDGLAGKSALVAMSGGVDSAVAAMLVKEAGLRVIGLTMKNYCYGESDVPDRSCCSIEAINDARRECERLGIPHQVADVEALFTHEVIDNFLAEYANARTPNPCVRCNSIVRFKTLLDHADKLGVEYVATGHYARVFETPHGGRYLARSVDRQKDQSYFLSGVTGGTLGRVVFPLGDYDKPAVRELAGSASMSVAVKPESQEVCFVPDGTLRSFLASRDVALQPGNIESVDGEVLGRHEGIAAYTIGQRRRLGIATGTPQYVVELDKSRNVVVVGGDDALLAGALKCRFGWIDADAALSARSITAQIRYRHRGAGVERIVADGDAYRLVFAEPQRAVCPGQTVALYEGDVVVASGVIDGPVVG